MLGQAAVSTEDEIDARVYMRAEDDPSLQLDVREKQKRDISSEEIAGVRADLTQDESARCDDSMVRRYIRAVGGDRPQAVARLRETLRWHEEEKPTQMYCSACSREPKSHYMQVVAFDRCSRPAIYSCLSIPTNHALEDNRVHMISVFEQAIAAMRGGVEDWVWVLDMHGFGLRNIDPRLAFAFLKVSAAHYPERLAQAYIISAPRIFHGFWKTISPFIDPKTKSKIFFGNFQKHGDNTHIRAALSKTLDAPSVDWFMVEMEENRHKSIARHKHYWYPDLAAVARSPDNAAISLARERRLADSLTKSHDFLGTEDYQNQLRGHPERLPPSVFSVADNSVHRHPKHHHRRRPSAG